MEAPQLTPDPMNLVWARRQLHANAEKVTVKVSGRSFASNAQSAKSDEHYPVSVGGWDNPYVSFFGPPMNKVKTGFYDNVPRETDNLPDAYEGRNLFLMSTMDFMITENDEWVTDVLPWFHTDELHARWQEFKFDRTWPDLVPEQAPSRYITHTMETREAHLLRRGMAFIIEWGFFNTDVGKSHYIANLQVMRSGVLTLVYYSGIFALLTAKDYYREKVRAAPGNLFSIADALASEYRRWAIMQKEVEGWLMIDKDADSLSSAESVKFDTWIVPVGMASYCNQIQEGKLDYSSSGPKAASTFNKRTFNVFRNKVVHEVKDVDADFMDAPTNLMKRERTIGDFFTVSDSHILSLDNYKSDMKSTFIFNMDTVHGGFSKITEDMCLLNCSRFGSDGRLSIHHHDMIADLDNAMGRFKVKLADDQIDMFVVRDLPEGANYNTGYNPNQDSASSGYRVIEFFGEQYPRYFNDTAFTRFMESCRGRIHRYLTAAELGAYAEGEQLMANLSNSNLTRELGAYAWAGVQKNGFDPNTNMVIPNRFGSQTPPNFITISRSDPNKYLATGPEQKNLVVRIGDVDVEHLSNWSFDYEQDADKRDAKTAAKETFLNAIYTIRYGYQQFSSAYTTLDKIKDAALEFFAAAANAPAAAEAAKLLYSDTRLAPAMEWYTKQIKPYGYGNWPGMRTLSWLYQNADRMGYDEKQLQIAYEYEKAALKIAALFGSVFYGDTHPGFDQKFCPAYHKAYDRAVDSMTAFMTNIMDSSKLPMFVRMASAPSGSPHETDEVGDMETDVLDQMLRTFGLPPNSDNRIAFNTLANYSASFRRLKSIPLAESFGPKFDASAGVNYCTIQGISARSATFKTFLDREVLDYATKSRLKEFQADPAVDGGVMVIPAASINLVDTVVDSVLSNSPLMLTPSVIAEIRNQAALKQYAPPATSGRMPIMNEDDALGAGVHRTTRPARQPGDVRDRVPGEANSYDSGMKNSPGIMVCTRLCIGPVAFHQYRERMKSLSIAGRAVSSAGETARNEIYKNYAEIPLYPANPANPARPLGIRLQGYINPTTEAGRIDGATNIGAAYDQFAFAAATVPRNGSGLPRASDPNEDANYISDDLFSNDAAPYFDAYATGGRNPDPLMYTAVGAPFTMPGGLSFNKNMVARYNFASTNAKDSISRAAGLMYVMTEVTAHQLQRWSRSDIVTPVDYLGERPFKRYFMGSVIACKAGFSLGATMYGHEDFQMMVRGDIKVMIGHYTINHAPVVKNHRLHVTFEDVFAMGYLGGEGIEFFDTSLDLNSIREDRRSIFMFMLPYGSTRNAVASSIGAPPLRVMSPHSLIGQWESRDFVSSVSSKMAASTWLDWHYESMVYYNYIFKFHRLQNAAPPETFNFANCPPTNIVTWQGFQVIWNPSKGDFSRFIANQDPFGPHVYPGCKAVRCGDTLTFNKDYKLEAVS